jgi:predicted RNA-binding protein with PUA-like domain
MSTKKYWLMKSEPETFSLEQLRRDKTTLWTGVRNYQARNFMKEMSVGDEVLFYHSNAEPSGVAGLARVSKTAVPDPTQFDKKSEYYDPKASPEKPIWFCVEIKYIKSFQRLLSLADLREEKSVSTMLVLKKGQRLSVQPVTEKEFAAVQKMGEA